MKTRADAITGCLWGCALGDALGLPAEGLSPATIARRFGPLERFHLLGRTGFVSDDTEQTALVAESLVVARRGAGVDVDAAVRHFRRRLRFWFLRLPFGVGLATVRACVRLLLGVARSGVNSAGNGAAMRSAVVGAVLVDGAVRLEMARALARVTHLDPRAVDGAAFVAEVAAQAASATPDADRLQLVHAALPVVGEASLRTAVELAVSVARSDAPDAVATGQVGTSGFVLHTVGLATWAFVRHGGDPAEAVRATIRAGGDTDSNAAIVGAWVGALHGGSSLPADLLGALAGGPFGRAHLSALADALAQGASTPPRWSALLAFGRNLALFPVVLAHGFRRLLPF